MARFNAETDPTFQRAMRLISALTQANPAQVTTSFDHDYETGDIVRLIVPFGYGMIEADGLTGEIEVTGTDTFTIDIDTTKFSTFNIPSPVPWYRGQYPHVRPVGEISSKLTSATTNTLPH